ncbi:MAG: GIY-YIG nuclease family protein [Proteobacteria bacterium]|nr:GIY-YIG nuclease family protein [Pseudomonadota bacterium]
MDTAAIASDAGSVPESKPRIVPDGASNDEGYVYCIAEYMDGRETGYFKIGTAKDSDKRLKDLQTGNPCELKIWKEPQWVSKRLNAEKAAHAALKEYKVDQGGGTEWFKVPQDEQDNFYDLFCEAIR